MGKLLKVGLVVGIAFAYLSYHIHRPIPADVPNSISFQVLVDYLSTVEFVATITEWLGFSNRWWFYPGNINITLPLPTKDGVQFTYSNFAGVDSMVITTKEFRDRSSPGPALVFFHGGGWVFGNLPTYKSVFQQAVKETEFLVVSPEYRKAPLHPFPAPFKDCLHSTIAFIKKAKDYNVDPNKIVIAGDSAGGNLAMAVTLELIKFNKENPDIPVPSMTALIYPVLQMANYRLPSYQQNAQFMFYPSLIPKFWLSYIGLNHRMDLSPIIAINGHVREGMEGKVGIVHSSKVPEKYKVRGFNSTKIMPSESQKKLLDEEVVEIMEKSLMDVRIAPLMANDALLTQMPRTHILVCEYDTLRDDGILLYERLKSLGRNVTLQHIPDTLHASLNIGSIFQQQFYGLQNALFFKIVKDYFQ